MNKVRIEAVHYEQGKIERVRLSDGRDISIGEAVKLAGANKIEGVIVGGTRDGGSSIHGVADGDPSNNLANKPQY